MSTNHRTAQVELVTPQVPIDSVHVWPASVNGGVGFHVQFGQLLVWVESAAHWSDLNERVMSCFDDLPARRLVPLPRTDGVTL